MVGKLRSEICKHEEATGEKFGCFESIRCLSCPMSYLGCPISRKNLK